MAFINRSPRDVSMAIGNTPSHLGPGSYFKKEPPPDELQFYMDTALMAEHDMNLPQHFKFRYACDSQLFSNVMLP